MARMGFIQDKLEIKFLLLYIASRLIEPVPFEAMQELAMIDDGVDFFDFSECMNDLVTSGHLTLSEDGLYAITEKGLRNGQICESSLPYSVRLAADKNITVFNQKLRRRAQIRSEITPRPNGTYTVSLAFCDEQDSPLLKMELMVPKDIIETLCIVVYDFFHSKSSNEKPIFTRIQYPLAFASAYQTVHLSALPLRKHL